MSDQQLHMLEHRLAAIERAMSLGESVAHAQHLETLEQRVATLEASVQSLESAIISLDEYYAQSELISSEAHPSDIQGAVESGGK